MSSADVQSPLNVRTEETWTLHLVSLRKPFPLQIYIKSEALILTAQTSMAVHMHLHWNSKQCQRE